MKSALTIVLTIFLISCKLTKHPQNNISEENMVDYNQNYDYENRTLNFKKFEEEMKNKTIYFVDSKLVDYKSFTSILNEGKIKNIKVLSDSSDIVKMDFSYEQIKKIIIVTKK